MDTTIKAEGPVLPAVPPVLPLLVVEEVPVEHLLADPANPRRISEAMLDALGRSIASFGFVQPILARRADHVVIGGHQRLVAAIRRGLTRVPVIWLDVSAREGKLLNTALNRIGGDWDDELLARLLADLGASSELDLELSGFRGDEINDLLRTLDVQAKRDRPESFDLDAALEAARGAPRTAVGDLWHLGEHRLVVGDATRAPDLERALGGRRADLAVTDPPYGVNFGEHGGHDCNRRRRSIANDALDPVAWAAFCQAWAANLLAAVDGALYICMSSKELPRVWAILAEAGGHWSDTIIWAKDRFTLGRADYQHEYEPVWYGWREGAGHHWCGDRDQSDLWLIDRPTESPLHPTMKPVELFERMLRNSSELGGLVLDPFAGSGTTLIAAERTGRIAALVEIDPRYADVILARWEGFSGRTPTKVAV